jgi:hypothetical protein
MTNALVCACDQHTYENRCEANALGLSVLHDGPCAPPSQDCGGWNPTPCPDDAFCNWPAGSTCGGGDVPGQCQARPYECPAVVDTVCGCNGQTYSNECEANAAAVSILGKGACAAFQ